MNHICRFCRGDHDFSFDCGPRTEAYERLKAEGEARRKRNLDEAREWPPRGRTARSWTAHGLLCAVVHGPSSYCGYVLVPDGHPDERKHYDDVEVSVHGDLTFRCKAIGGGSWFGFDCGHAGDWVGFAGTGIESPGRIWTAEDVAEETERLAEQLAAKVKA
jgi:hypothetical protein